MPWKTPITRLVAGSVLAPLLGVLGIKNRSKSARKKKERGQMSSNIPEKSTFDINFV